MKQKQKNKEKEEKNNFQKKINWKEELNKEYLLYLGKHTIIFFLFILFLFFSLQNWINYNTICTIEGPFYNETFSQAELYNYVETKYLYWGITKEYNFTSFEENNINTQITCEFILPKKEGKYEPWNMKKATLEN